MPVGPTPPQLQRSGHRSCACQKFFLECTHYDQSSQAETALDTTTPVSSLTAQGGGASESRSFQLDKNPTLLQKADPYLAGDTIDPNHTQSTSEGEEPTVSDVTFSSSTGTSLLPGQACETCHESKLNCTHIDPSRRTHLGAVASNCTGEYGGDLAPHVGELKLLTSCEPCNKAKRSCVRPSAGARGSICERCSSSEGKYTCVYTYAKPRDFQKCDECRSLGERCYQPTRCEPCILSNTTPCIHRVCARCDQLEIPCDWSELRGRRALTCLWQKKPMFVAIESGKAKMGSNSDSDIPVVRVEEDEEKCQ